MFPDHASIYPANLLEERARIQESGGLRDKIRYDLTPRPHYAFGLLAAADMARFAGQNRITAIEFGVAEGKGLLTMCELATAIEDETGIGFDIVGFDTGEGLPELLDHRDHPEIWSQGDFAGIGRKELEAKLPENCRMVWGDVRETLHDAIAGLSAPVGFVANDLDMYSSTIGSLDLFKAAHDHLLPVIMCYFDDTLGSPTRIGSLFRNDWCGQLAAIREFNEANATRKIDIIRTLKARRPLNRELWLDQIYAAHVLDHPLRQVGAERTSLMMDEHGTDHSFEWTL
ncbi:MAG: hypothetical protein MRY32_01710 [Rickettsiales bacterium]|nr:hypothetical protein [Rickettsiales bacterium]